jgi:Cytochrome C oxidase, cbb3-type, subunit III
VKFQIRPIAGIASLYALLALPVACAGDDHAAPAGSAQAAASTAAADDSSKPAADSGDKPYSVECSKDPETGENHCLVDKATYIGWRTFNSVCYVCHGQDAVGTTFAPSLVERLQQIDKERFMYVVHNGFQGQIGVMPAWKDNPNVNKHFDELYSYVKARSDGALPTGRPERKPE